MIKVVLVNPINKPLPGRLFEVQLIVYQVILYRLYRAEKKILIDVGRSSPDTRHNHAQN